MVKFLLLWEYGKCEFSNVIEINMSGLNVIFFFFNN